MRLETTLEQTTLEPYVLLLLPAGGQILGPPGSEEDEAQPSGLLPGGLQRPRPGRAELPRLPGLGRGVRPGVQIRTGTRTWGCFGTWAGACCYVWTWAKAWYRSRAWAGTWCGSGSWTGGAWGCVRTWCYFRTWAESAAWARSWISTGARSCTIACSQTGLWDCTQSQ